MAAQYFPIGARVASVADLDHLTGTVVSAPAPGMRRIAWDDGDSGDVDTRDIQLEII